MDQDSWLNVALVLAFILIGGAFAGLRPVVWLLSVSTNAVVRLLGGDPSAKSDAMTEEELRELVVAHKGLPDDERRILKDVFDAADSPLGEVMRPRGDVVFLPESLSMADATALAATSRTLGTRSSGRGSTTSWASCTCATC